MGRWCLRRKRTTSLLLRCMALWVFCGRSAYSGSIPMAKTRESPVFLKLCYGFFDVKTDCRFRLIRPLPTYPRFEESDDEAEAGRQAVSSGPAGDHPMYHTPPAGHPPVQPAEIRDAQGAVPAPPPPPIPTRPAPLPADQAWGMYT